MRDFQRSQVGVNDPLTKATEVMKKLDSPEASLAKIEFLVCLTALLLFLLPILSSSRRRHNNRMLKIVLWAANTLSSSLITYTLGLMTEASFQNELLLIWATFLLIFFGCSGSFSAYGLEDNEQWKNYYWQCGIKSFLVLTVVIVHGGMAQISLAGILLFLVGPLKFSERLGSNIIACGDSLLRTTKLIADYMSSEHRLSDTSYPDHIEMRGYKYVVRGEETRLIDGFGFTIFKRRKEREAAAQMEGPKYRKSLKITDQIITVENVWACQGWLLRDGDEDNKLKDICLSFSLYKLLSLKFFSYSLPKEAHEKLWKLIRHGLLAEEKGYERAFRVIELELSFLFDSFYTTYPIIFKPGCWPIKMMEVLLFGHWFPGDNRDFVSCGTTQQDPNTEFNWLLQAG